MTDVINVIKTERTAGTNQTDIAKVLNKKGFTTATGKKWNNNSVNYVAHQAGIKWTRGRTGTVNTKTTRTTRTATTTATSGAWKTYVNEIRTSNLSSATRAYLFNLIIDSI